MTEHDQQPTYRLEKVSRTYGRGPQAVHALTDADLVIRPGDRMGIVGESGSGKSTLIRIMAGLDRATSGTVHFDGRPLDLGNREVVANLRSRVAMVFQDPRSSLNPRMKVGEIITEPLRSKLVRSRAGMASDHRQRLREVMDQVGLDPALADRYPHEFSGGQRQRIAIARALTTKPEVLIADEPVSALDVSVRAQVLNLLHDLVGEYGMTMVFVSHDLTVVRHVCDQVAVMQRGRIVEHGTLSEVYAHPTSEYTRSLLKAVPRIRTRAQRS